MDQFFGIGANPLTTQGGPLVDFWGQKRCDVRVNVVVFGGFNSKVEYARSLDRALCIQTVAFA